MSKLAELREEYTNELKAVDALFAQYEETDMPEDVVADVTARNQKLKAQLEELRELEAREQIRRETQDELKRLTVPHPGGASDGEQANGQRKGVELATIGHRFTDSKEFKDWFASMAPHGHIAESMRIGNSPQFVVPGLMKALTKDLVTGASDTSAGAFVSNDVTGLFAALGRRPLAVFDLITRSQTDSDTVEFVRQTTRTNAAAPVAEATAVAGGSGAKPESAVAYEKVTVPVRTIAHWIPATKRALSDVPFMRGLIDAELRDGLDEELEDQVVNGDGLSENFTGLVTDTGVQDQAWATDILTTTRQARTKVRVVGRATPTAFLLHPNDWEKIDLLQDNEGRYFYGGPARLGVPVLWGLPVVESEVVPEGKGFVGDFRRAYLWDREQATIQVSDSHSDFFTRNLVAILAELRAAFGITRPDAFVEIDLTA